MIVRSRLPRFIALNEISEVGYVFGKSSSICDRFPCTYTLSIARLVQETVSVSPFRIAMCVVSIESAKADEIPKKVNSITAATNMTLW